MSSHTRPIARQLPRKLRKFVSDITPSFVFDDYTWAVDDTPYSHLDGELIPSRIPLSALIDGKEHFFLGWHER